MLSNTSIIYCLHFRFIGLLGLWLIWQNIHDVTNIALQRITDFLEDVGRDIIIARELAYGVATDPRQCDQILLFQVSVIVALLL
jgi:hypothetical protein